MTTIERKIMAHQDKAESKLITRILQHCNMCVDPEPIAPVVIVWFGTMRPCEICELPIEDMKQWKRWTRVYLKQHPAMLAELARRLDLIPNDQEA